MAEAIRRLDPKGFGDGGAGGIRTPDLIIANDALSQLSYSPERRMFNPITVAVLQRPRFGLRSFDSRLAGRAATRYRPYGSDDSDSAVASSAMAVNVATTSSDMAVTVAAAASLTAVAVDIAC